MRNHASKRTLRDALTQELQELSLLERAFMMALPMMAQSACDAQLQRELERLHGQTREQIARLNRIIAPATTGTAPQLFDFPQISAAPPVRDALLIAAVRQIHHQKIALYSTAQAWARTLGLEEVEQMVAQNLEQDTQNCDCLRHVEFGSSNNA